MCHYSSTSHDTRQSLQFTNHSSSSSRAAGRLHETLLHSAAMAAGICATLLDQEGTGSSRSWTTLQCGGAVGAMLAVKSTQEPCDGPPGLRRVDRTSSTMFVLAQTSKLTQLSCNCCLYFTVKGTSTCILADRETKALFFYSKHPNAGFVLRI